MDFENRSGKARWTVEGVYREEGKSGKDLKRPEFERMMRDIYDGRINTIVIWKIDRLTRSLADFCKVWDILEERGVQLVSLNEKFDTATAIGRAMLKIILIFAELEREQTSERTAMAMDYRANQGLWNGGRVIGYEPDPASKGGLRVVSEFADVVRIAFDICRERGSAGATTRELNTRGYRMPSYESRRGKTHGGGMFTKQAVIRVLTNPVYVGKFKWHGNVFDGQHEPIVTQSKFDAVQNILKVNRRNPNARRAPQRHVFILQGLLRCGKCGAMMTPAWSTSRSKAPYHYYGCSKRQHVGKEGCQAKTVPAIALEKLILERLKELSSDPSEVERMVDRANGRQSEMLRKLARDQQRLNREHQSVVEKFNSLVKALEAGGAKAFRSVSERMSQLEAERSDLEQQMELTKFEACRIKEETLSVKTMTETFRTLHHVIESASPERIKTSIHQVIEVIEWHKDPKTPGAGHYRIAYFEQPRLGLRRGIPTEQRGDIGAAPGTDWLRRQGSNL